MRLSPLAASRTLGVLLAAALLAGCYTTSIRSGAPAEPIVYTDRQWFMIAGLVDISDPAGHECPQGVAWTKSEYTVLDALIHFGLTAAGAAIGFAACADIDEAKAQASCVSSLTSLPPLLFGSRTVHYSCKATAPAVRMLPGTEAPRLPAAQVPEIHAPEQEAR